MKKLIASLATIVLMAGSVTSATAATQQNDKIPAPYIDPGTPSKAQQEANQINYASVTLNDTASTSYLNTTAEQDKTVIEQQLEANQELDPKTAGDFTFDNTTPLQWYVKNRISYHTQASDRSKGSGVLDIYVNPYKPGPTPPKKASTLTPSDPKASTINPSEKKASTIGPSDPKASIIGPSTKKKEDAEDIANKLFNKSIKLDPNFWLGKNIKDYQSQFNATVVKDGILTQDEIQYISWGNVDINVAGYFVNKLTFSVKKDGATATGSSTIDADSGSTPAQIAAKLTKASIYFNYTYWNKKTLQDNIPLIQSILVNEKILTKAEASVVVGLASPVTISKAGIVDVDFNVNDNKTNTKADVKINVHNDGKTAQQVADGINKVGFGLKTNTAGMYADSQYVTKSFRDIAVNNYGQTTVDMNDVTLPHVKLQADNPNLTASILKDGQTASAQIDLECKTNPYIYYYSAASDHMQAYVNLTPDFLQTLKSYFADSSHTTQQDLGYFYQMLDDGYAVTLPIYTGKQYVPPANRLDQNINNFGDNLDSRARIIQYEADTTNTAIGGFETDLSQAIMNSNGYLTVAFDWTYVPTAVLNPYTIKQWKIW